MGKVGCVVFSLLLNCCATQEKQEPRVRAAAFGMDNFVFESGMPVREVKKHDFFYKRCDLNSRRAFPSKIDYSCNDAQLNN
ncbi:MAG: hypothetical protein JNM39_14715 [Bdellovibrionaceae bacterium]|nr:hypothetical protein [Pseudobdellovibrionaceae bacterium]